MSRTPLDRAVDVLVLGAASSVTTALVTQDTIPGEAIRGWWQRRYPPRQQELKGPVDGVPRDPRLHESYEWKGTKLGEVITCPRCFGVWSTFAWAAASAVAPRATRAAALPFAAAAVQRFLNART